MAGAVIIFGLMFKPLLDDMATRINDTTISKYQYILKTPEDAGDDSAERFALETLETTKRDYKTDEISVYGIEEDSKYISKDIPEGKVLLSNGYMDKYGLKAEDILMIDDLKPGLDMAKAAGIDFAAACWCFDIPENEKYMRENATYLCTSVKELEKIQWGE